MNEDLILIKRLEELRAEHRNIDQMLKQEFFDEFTAQRKKKEKLALQDQIFKLEQIIYPDIIA